MRKIIIASLFIGLVIIVKYDLCYGTESAKLEKRTVEITESATSEVKSGKVNQIPEFLKKAYEKSTNNVSYTLESKALGKIKVYYKNAETYRIDTENKGKKTSTVVKDGKALIYDEAKDLLMDSPVPESELEKFQKYGVNSVIDEEFMIYSYLNKESKIKCELVIDTRENLIIKERVYDTAGKLLAEADFKDYNFSVQNDEIFEKPGLKKEENPAAKKEVETQENKVLNETKNEKL